jgi:serine/threonine protein kinase
MPAPATVAAFLELVRKSGVVDGARLDGYLQQLGGPAALPGEPKALAADLVRDGILTRFQAEQFLLGRWRGFNLGKYQILERIGSGGMGVVYLAEHKLLRRRVAIKVLPVTLASDPWFIERFYHEAQAVAALDHPNIVRAHDVDQEGKLHFLVMEFVDGSSLQEIVGRHGPMDVLRATHYIRQAALALQHAHSFGLVHRDIKPGNLLLDRQGTIKILDLGLAFCRDSKAAKGGDNPASDERMVGTDDYLAPEQIVNSDDVDIRADIYSLGATFYFLLKGGPPFEEVAGGYQKLIGHLVRRPKPIRQFRPEVPEGLAAVLEKMMAKNPWDRYQTPAALADALAAWTLTPIPPPPAEEMPKLSPAARQRRAFEPRPVPAALGTAAGKSWVLTGPSSTPTNGSGVLAEPPLSQGQTPTGSSAVTQHGGNPTDPAKGNTP